MGRGMDDGSFCDEGLVAAACGMLLEHNPYEVGTVHYREWREGFFSYGRVRRASRLELPSGRAELFVHRARNRFEIIDSN